MFGGVAFICCMFVCVYVSLCVCVCGARVHRFHACMPVRVRACVWAKMYLINPSFCRLFFCCIFESHIILLIYLTFTSSVKSSRCLMLKCTVEL